MTGFWSLLNRGFRHHPVLTSLDATISWPSYLISSGSLFPGCGHFSALVHDILRFSSARCGFKLPEVLNGLRGHKGFCDLGLQKERHVSHAQKAANLASLPTQGQESKDLGGFVLFLANGFYMKTWMFGDKIWIWIWIWI